MLELYLFAEVSLRNLQVLSHLPTVLEQGQVAILDPNQLGERKQHRTEYFNRCRLCRFPHVHETYTLGDFMLKHFSLNVSTEVVSLFHPVSLRAVSTAVTRGTYIRSTSDCLQTWTSQHWDHYGFTSAGNPAPLVFQLGNSGALHCTQRVLIQPFCSAVFAALSRVPLSD